MSAGGLTVVKLLELTPMKTFESVNWSISEHAVIPVSVDLAPAEALSVLLRGSASVALKEIINMGRYDYFVELSVFQEAINICSVFHFHLHHLFLQFWVVIFF